jgi:hypothetical protein
MQDSEIRLNVADLVVSITTELGVRVVGRVDSFVVDEPAEAAINVRLKHQNSRSADWHPLSTGKHLGWNAFANEDGESILVERLGGNLLVRAEAKQPCEVVDVLLGTPETVRPGDRPPDREVLLVEVLPVPVVMLLSGRSGLFLHSCAVALEEAGILFSGVSGSGKSTMAGLWHRFGPPSSTVIDDEHILARHRAETLLIYGAPWSRGPRTASFSRTPLRFIFFLSHGEQNECTRMTAGEAFAQLLSQVFLPLWSREQVELTMQTCSALLQDVACYHLRFVPGPEVVHFVQDLLRGSM